MKKLLSLLSVLTISGTTVPTTIAASPYQKEKKINSDINLKTNNLEILNRNKKDFYEKEQIEFFNNDFFYKFNLQYNKEKNTNGAFDRNASVQFVDSITLIKDWTKYANSWEEFLIKFPEIELVNFKSVIDEQEIIKNSFKIKNTKNKNSRWSEYNFNLHVYNNHYEPTSFNHEKYWDKPINDDNVGELNSYSYNSLLCRKRGKILYRLYVDQKELKSQFFYNLNTLNCSSSYKGSLKFDSVRLVGDIDVNPLFSLTIEKAKQFDIWSSSKEKELKAKREDPNYNKFHLLNEENFFKENFKLWLLQIRHDYIQDLVNINQNNEIIGLKLEIDNIKSRLDELEKSKTCLDNIFDSFKKNTLSDAPGNTWQSIKENNGSPLKVIIKKSGKAFASGLLTGIAKGSAISIISCFADSII